MESSADFLKNLLRDKNVLTENKSDDYEVKGNLYSDKSYDSKTVNNVDKAFLRRDACGRYNQDGGNSNGTRSSGNGNYDNIHNTIGYNNINNVITNNTNSNYNNNNYGINNAFQNNNSSIIRYHNNNNVIMNNDNNVNNVNNMNNSAISKIVGDDYGKNGTNHTVNNDSRNRNHNDNKNSSSSSSNSNDANFHNNQNSNNGNKYQNNNNYNVIRDSNNHHNHLNNRSHNHNNHNNDSTDNNLNYRSNEMNTNRVNKITLPSDPILSSYGGAVIIPSHGPVGQAGQTGQSFQAPNFPYQTSTLPQKFIPPPTLRDNRDSRYAPAVSGPGQDNGKANHPRLQEYVARMNNQGKYMNE